MANEIIDRAVQRLATRGIHTEADIQSEIQTLLAGGELNLTADQAPKLEEQTTETAHAGASISRSATA